MRTKSLFILLFSLFCISQSGVAQKLYIGPKLGLNISNVSNNETLAYSNNGGEYYYFDQMPLCSAHFGGFVQYHFNKKLALQGELLFSEQGYLYDSDLDNIFDDDFDRLNSQSLIYLSVPTLAKFYLFKGLNISVGPQFNFLIASDLDSTPHNNLNKFDFGGVIGMGYDFWFGLTLDVRYCQGFTNINKSTIFTDGLNSRNQVFQMSSGWRFRIK